jgi:hypothetical protein
VQTNLNIGGVAHAAPNEALCGGFGRKTKKYDMKGKPGSLDASVNKDRSKSL